MIQSACWIGIDAASASRLRSVIGRLPIYGNVLLGKLGVDCAKQGEIVDLPLARRVISRVATRVVTLASN